MADDENSILLKRIQSGDYIALREALDKNADKYIQAFLQYGHSKEDCVDMLFLIFKAVQDNSKDIDHLGTYITMKACEVNRAFLKKLADKELQGVS